MKLEIDIPEGQETAIFEQAVYGVADEDLFRQKNPEAKVSFMYEILKQVINQIGSAVPDESRKEIYGNLQKHISEQTGVPIAEPGENGAEETEAIAETITQAAQQTEPKTEDDEHSNDQ